MGLEAFQTLAFLLELPVDLFLSDGETGDEFFQFIIGHLGSPTGRGRKTTALIFQSDLPVSWKISLRDSASSTRSAQRSSCAWVAFCRSLCSEGGRAPKRRWS